MKILLYFTFFLIAVTGCISGKPSLVIFTTIPFCILLLVYIKLAWKGSKKKGSQTKATKTISTEAKESFTKAIKDYNVLQDLRQEIASDSVRIRLTELQRTAKGVLDYLEQNPERMSAAEDFIEIYQDRAVSLINQYLSLEKIRFSCKEMDEAKIHVEKVLSSLNETYKKEFKRIIDFQFMDFHAEADTFQWAMGESKDVGNSINPEEPLTALKQENTQKKEEGFLERNYDFSGLIDIAEPEESMFVMCGISLFFSFIVFAVLSFFWGTISSDNYFVVILIALARFILLFIIGLFFAIGIGELDKAKFEGIQLSSW